MWIWEQDSVQDIAGQCLCYPTVGTKEKALALLTEAQLLRRDSPVKR